MKDELYCQVNTTIIQAAFLSGKNTGKDQIVTHMFNIHTLLYELFIKCHTSKIIAK
jgi:hypothetical protein